MRNLCGHLVTSLGSSWRVIGWVLFLAAFAISMLAAGSPGMLSLAWALAVLTLFWWVIDVVDQGVPSWIVAVGVVMLIVGIWAEFVTLAAWVIYWTRVRE